MRPPRSGFGPSATTRAAGSTMGASGPVLTDDRTERRPGGPVPSSVSSSTPARAQKGEVKRPRTKRPELRTYVIDTSVLLSDPRAISRFDEHEVVLPVVVVIE